MSTCQNVENKTEVLDVKIVLNTNTDKPVVKLIKKRERTFK